MTTPHVHYTEGLLAGIIESGWSCHDCGNHYDAGVDHCPNQLLDTATATHRAATQHPATGPHQAPADNGHLYGYLADELTPDGQTIVIGPFPTRADAEQAAAGRPIVEMHLNEPRSGDGNTHAPECPNATGSCCPWIPSCDCQCICDLISDIEARIRGRVPQPWGMSLAGN